MKFADLYVGMVLRDNDPRYEGRTVVVTNTGVNNANDGGVYYHTGKRDQFIKADRIFDDGKPRHQGWSVHRADEVSCAYVSGYTDALARGFELGLKDK